MTDNTAYITGIDIQQNTIICIPIEGCVIYPNPTYIKESVPNSVKAQRIETNKIIGLLTSNKLPQQLIDSIASLLGSQIDKTFDLSNVEIMVGKNGFLYTLKNTKIVYGIENILKLKNEQENNIT